MGKLLWPPESRCCRDLSRAVATGFVFRSLSGVHISLPEGQPLPGYTPLMLGKAQGDMEGRGGISGGEGGALGREPQAQEAGQGWGRKLGAGCSWFAWKDIREFVAQGVRKLKSENIENMVEICHTENATRVPPDLY